MRGEAHIRGGFRLCWLASALITLHNGLLSNRHIGVLLLMTDARTGFREVNGPQVGTEAIGSNL